MRVPENEYPSASAAPPPSRAASSSSAASAAIASLRRTVTFTLGRWISCTP
uniref:Uncharacterized protein n=1 Tax=Arundo donax TaxID=35708 RepID=A0A0A9C1T3_ARUDO